MLKLAPELVARVQAAASGEDLFDLVQNAIELEHSTLPPYLTALFSLDPARNPEPANILQSVANEEMLHMAIAGNLLLAIGGKPVINRAGFIPTYPGPLPMSIGQGLIVGLAAFSVDLVRDVFMKIEEPETPLVFPTKPLLKAETAPTYATIGAFYAALRAKLVELGDGVFAGDPANQVVDARWFGADRLFAIHDVASACRGIDIIVQEGEGTSTSPLAGLGDGKQLAHYYRFAQIVEGRELVADPGVPQGWSYSGAPIAVDPAGVFPIQANTTLYDLPAGSRAAEVGERFADAYTRLLNALHAAFNGQPKALDRALGVMFELRVCALDCVRTPLANGRTVGLCYELAAVNA